MRSSKYRSGVVFEVVIVIAIIAFVNLLSLRFFARADLTEGNLFSVSESTREVLRGLDDLINVKVYFSKELPPYLATLTREVRDILDEYRAYAGGKLVIDFEDPAEDPDTEQRVRSIGIPPVQLNIIAKDKAEVMTAYLGIAVLFEDRTEVIPVVQNAANLEYDLTSAIVKVASREPRTVGFLAGHGEPEIDGEFEAIRTSLERQYTVKRVETAGGEMVPEDVNTLVVAGVGELSPWDQFAIDQFLMRGGRLFFMVDRVEIPEGTLYAIEAETGVDSLLQTYGVIVKPDLVVDRIAASATFSAGMFRYTLPYPLWPLVTREGFSKESPITNQLERAVFPWTGSIALIERGEAGPEVTVLAKSSDQSWSEEGRLDLNPQRSFAPQTEVAPRNLAVLLNGSFESYFRDRPVPTVEGVEVLQGEKLDRSPETEIVVISNSRMMRSNFLGNYPENRIFFLNAIDWLTLGDSLIGIRSRAVTSRPLKEIGEKSKASLRFTATFGIPIALIVWGLSRRYLRASRKLNRLQYPR